MEPIPYVRAAFDPKFPPLFSDASSVRAPVRIGIDIGPALGGPSGLQRYIQNFLMALAKQDEDNEYFLTSFFWKGFPNRAFELKLPSIPNFHIHLLRIPQRLLLPAEHYWGLRIHERLLAPLKLDLFHATSPILPRLNRLHSVLTVHHVGGIEPNPSLWRRFYFQRLSERSIAQAGLLIAISEHTREALIRDYGVKPERVRTVYYGGADPAYRPEPGGEHLSPRGIRRPYFLFVSAINARKNLPVLARAFAALQRERSGRYQLVFAAAREPDYFKTLIQILHELGIEQHSLFLEGLSADELRPLYQQAEALVYPSILEGFGLPLLEAMACGTPVIAAKASCLPEIGGDACLYFEPSNAEALTNAMRRVSIEESLRRTLRIRGLLRAAQFTWERNASETLKTYRDALAL